MELRDRVALVTGSARRVGRTIAHHLAARGCVIAVHYGASAREARDAVSEFRALGVSAAEFRAELAESDQCAGLISEVALKFGRLDILINSASVFPRTPFGRISAGTWDEIHNINLRAPFLLSQAAAPYLKESRGVIVHIGDVRIDRPRTTYVPYAASKAGLLNLTAGLARTLAPEIRVNAVGPGPVLFPQEYSEEEKSRAVRETLLKRAGSPEDVARAVVFLCENDYITGAFLPVDGGLHLS